MRHRKQDLIPIMTIKLKTNAKLRKDVLCRKDEFLLEKGIEVLLNRMNKKTLQSIFDAYKKDFIGVK